MTDVFVVEAWDVHSSEHVLFLGRFHNSICHLAKLIGVVEVVSRSGAHCRREKLISVS